jgi:hypothetical protein
MSSFIFFTTILTASLLIHLWSNTNFFAYYLKLIKWLLPKKIYLWLMVEEYFYDPSSSRYSSYIEYLYAQKQDTIYLISFILKLMSCPICLSTWVSILLSIVLFGNILYMGVIYIIILISNYIFNFFLKRAFI